MRIRFELLDKQENSLGRGDVQTNLGNISAAKDALRALGHMYTKCRWVKYTIWGDVLITPISQGKMFIEPWDEVC